ncbi:MAG TPA: VWA domain-containing protein [Candidatus Limnocylindrales bacterium]|nr:VWA domain-containing protein [Candidatus Limnocylindrales bacterium]
MTFLWPVALVLLLLVPLGVVAARRLDARRRQRVAALAGTFAPVTAARSPHPVLDRLAGAVVVAAFAVLVIALARPQATVAVPRLEGTLMLTFDVSASMAATDADPSRLEAAKATARDIVARRPQGVVIGVVAFSNAGMTVQAPTQDTAAVLASIDRLTPTEGTSLADGIASTLDAIDAAGAAAPADYYSSRTPEPTERPTGAEPGSDAATLIVLFSDGENTTEQDPLGAARLAADRGIRLLVMGVGTTAGVTLDLDGFSVQTRLDEATLTRLADLTAGTYVGPGEPDPAGAVYADLERRLVARVEEQELTAPVAALGLLLLVAGTAVSLARTGLVP